MCQCVIYRGTCFLWRNSLDLIKHGWGTLGRWDRTREPSNRARRGAHRKWKKQAITTRLRRPDDTSHVVVIFTAFPFDTVAFFVCNSFDVRVRLILQSYALSVNSVDKFWSSLKFGHRCEICRSSINRCHVESPALLYLIVLPFLLSIQFISIDLVFFNFLYRTRNSQIFTFF